MDLSTDMTSALQDLQAGRLDSAENTLLSILINYGGDIADFARTLKDRVRFGAERVVVDQIATMQARASDPFVGDLLGLFLLCVKTRFAAIARTDTVDVLGRMPLFHNKSANLLCVNLNIPITTCNYRCEYCFLKHDIKPDLSKLDRLGEIIDRLGAIPRPLGITLTPMGELMAVPKMWPFLTQAAALPNTAWVEIWSNLSRDPELLFEHIDPAKLCLIATYHPTEFRDFDRENEAFFARLGRAKGLVKDVSVNFVIYEKNMPFADALRRRLRDLGIYLTVNPQINKTNGYGKPIKPIDQNEISLARDMADNEFIDYFFIQHRRADVRCTAGRDMIDIKVDGRVTRCEHFSTSGRSNEEMGNIFDENGPLIDTVNRFCAKGGCACKSTLGYIEACVAKYKRIGTQHKYHRREVGEVGTHSYDPVVLDVDAREVLHT